MRLTLLRFCYKIKPYTKYLVSFLVLIKLYFIFMTYPVEIKEECEDKLSQNCNENADCVLASRGKARCKCRDGYVGNGFKCFSMLLFME